jgi:hypothetical protein
MLSPEQKKVFDEKTALAKAKRIAMANKKIKTHKQKNYIRGHLQAIRRFRTELELFIKLAKETHNRVNKALVKLERDYQL